MFNYLFYFYEEPISITLGSWISVGDIQINYGLLLDSLSMVVIVPVGIVTLAVLLYALDYMRHDPNRNRFYIILSIFAIFMTILVISDNYVMMFIGWEFVGVISYLLISFWNTRIAAMKSALSAILLNRMGDTLFVICIGCMLSYFHAVDFETIELMSPHINTTLLNLLAIMLLVAATAKSAQLGLHGWLLSAMEGYLWALFKFHYMLEHPILLTTFYNILPEGKDIIADSQLKDSHKGKLSWSSLLYKSFGKIQDKGQSAGNIIMYNGSSETTRETYIKDIKISNNLPPIGKKISPPQGGYDDKFKLWFIGFTEGNGYFIMKPPPKGGGSSHQPCLARGGDNKNKSLEFKIIQPSVDAQVLFYIKKELGFGSVSIKDKLNKTHHYRVKDKNNILKLINIFNGNLFLTKNKEQFKLWLIEYNKYYTLPALNEGGYIKLLDNNFKPTLKDTWLLGFTDAEDCFTSSVLIDKNKNRKVYIKYILNLKINEDLAIYLAKLINGYYTYLKSSDSYIITSTTNNLNQLYLYFNKNKLKTKKYLNYINWYKILLLVKNKEHLNIEGFNKIKILSSKKNK